MTIDQRRYVDIASGVIGATAVPMQKLDWRVMTDNVLVPTDSVLEFTGATAVAEYFGATSLEATLAAAYFSYVSPAPVGRAKAIQFAAHLASTRAPAITGSADVGTITQIQGLGSTASFTLNFETASGPDAEAVTVDLSAVTSYAEVANALTTAFSSTPNAVSVQYTVLAGHGRFVATMPDDTYTQATFAAGAPADTLGLSAGASFDAGGAAQTMVEALVATVSRNDSFGSLWFETQGDLEEAIAAAQMIASYNVKHQLYLDVSPAEAEDYYAALAGVASVGLILRRPSDPHTLAALPAAIMSATDYDRANATTNYMFRQTGFVFPPQVASDLDANRYDPIRVNYYGRTAVAGSTLDFFQRAYLCGGVSAPVDMSVHANEQWLKAYIAQQWFTLLVSTRGIPANVDGAARMRVIVADAVTRALNNGTILPGKTLTPGQILAITDASGDDYAWHDVRDKGYWYDVFIEENTGPSGLPEYVGKYTLIYGKGDWVRKVEGSHNLV